MALHIYEGKHHPVFLYRWSYVGSLKAHITALITWICDEPVLAFAFAAILMYGVFAGASYVLARQVLGRKESALAVSYVLFAPGFLTAWGAHNEGNYIDVLAVGTAMLALGCRLLVESGGRLRRAFWLGILGGLAFWAHILATYYLIAAIVAIVAADWSRRILPRLAVFLGGFVLGDLPGIFWNASHSWMSFRWWALDQSAQGDRLSRAVGQFKEVLTTSFAVLAGWWPVDHPPWPGSFWRWTLLIVIPAAVALTIVRFHRSFHPLLQGRLRPEVFLLFFAVAVVAIFAQSSFGWMTDEPRYLLFLYSVVPIFVASALGLLARHSKIAFVLAAVSIGYVNLHGSGVYWSRAVESDAVNRKFIGELEDLGIRYGHTDYYISYKYNFLSHGRLVLTSALGPSQTEWYEPYRDEVARASRVALIPRSYRFARRIGRRLTRRGIRYSRVDLLYPVLFDFSEKVELKDLR
jgi:4-amino-4-deoxy-L-arabinose transferase-like glycosyltransferase